MSDAGNGHVRTARRPSIAAFRLDRESDRVERRGDRVFLVDLLDRFDEIEVDPAEITGRPREKLMLKGETLEKLAELARNFASSAYLSEEGRRERLEDIREIVEGKFPGGFFSDRPVPEPALPVGEDERILKMKMMATEALAGIWLEPRPSPSEAMSIAINALQDIQSYGVWAMSHEAGESEP